MAVTRQQNKKWKVDISDGYDAVTGEQKRHRKTDFKTRKEAERYEADYRINKLHQVTHKDKVSVSYLYSLVKEEDELRGNKRGTIDSQESYYRVSCPNTSKMRTCELFPSRTSKNIEIGLKANLV